MGKRMPQSHRCDQCANVVLDIETDDTTETHKFQQWMDFVAASTSVSPIGNMQAMVRDGFDDWLQFELKRSSILALTTMETLRSKAQNGCLFFAYIHSSLSLIIEKFFQLPDVCWATRRSDYDFLSFGGKPGKRWSECDEHILLCARKYRNPQTSFLSIMFTAFIAPYATFYSKCLPDPSRPYPEIRRRFHGVNLIDTALEADERFDLLMESKHDGFPEVVWEPFDYEPGSLKSLERARTWFQERPSSEQRRPGLLQRLLSLEEDKEGPSDSAYLPTRLLKIDGHVSDLDLQLVKGKSLPRNASYAVSSYCWGGDQKTKLTRANEEELDRGVKVQGLPATLRDAVTVTLALGLSYLWVDALCIMQDNDEDKGREIGLMASTYASASICIAAWRASSVEEGFLGERLPFRDSACHFFALSCRYKPDTEPAVVTLFPQKDLDRTIDPLQTRGWAYQERMLSFPLLEFASLTTRYFAPDGNDIKILQDGSRAYHPNMNPSLQRIASSSRTLYDLGRAWAFLLERYTRLKLSFAIDRLPAIGAVASLVEYAQHTEYLAGIWLFTLPLGLLWTVDLLDEEKEGLSEQYTAPSWSWASTVSPIKDYPWESGEDFVPDQGIQILEHRIDLLMEQAPYGAVRYGEIQVRGRLQAVELELGTGDTPWPLGTAQSMQLWGHHSQGLYRTRYDESVYEHEPSRLFQDKRLPMEISLDRHSNAVRELMAQSLGLYVLPVASCPPTPMPNFERENGIEQPEWRRIRGLILAHHSEQKFSRIGHFHLCPRIFIPDSDSNLDAADVAERTGLVDEWYSSQTDWLQAGSWTDLVLI